MLASSAQALANKISDAILNPIILLLFSLALIFFLWGLVVFIWKADNPDARKTGISHMLWGIIGMFVMLSAFGIIKLIQSTIGV